MQHWHLDVTFKEDECRARMGFTSQNLSVLRKIALHIVSEQKDKLSMKRRLYKAALDINKNYWNFDAVALILHRRDKESAVLQRKGSEKRTVFRRNRAR